MPKKIERKTKIVEKDVDYMVDPSASFVSLVTHGANGESFFVVKSKDKNLPDGLIVQRVIVPKSLKKDEADALLKGFIIDDEQDYPTHLAYNQIALDRCNEESFQVIKMDAEGKLMAVIGELKDGVDLQPVAASKEKVIKEIPSEVRWDISDEVWKLETLIMATASQSNAEAEWQKSTILTAMDNFKGFLTTALETVPADKMVSMKHRDTTAEIMDMVRKELKKHNQQEESMSDEFKIKDQDELKALVRKCIEEFVAEKAESDKNKQSRDAKAKEKKDFDDGYTKLTETVEGLAKAVKAIEGQAPPSGTEGDDTDATLPPKKEDAEESVFKGLFLKEVA